MQRRSPDYRVTTAWDFGLLLLLLLFLLGCCFFFFKWDLCNHVNIFHRLNIWETSSLKPWHQLVVETWIFPPPSVPQTCRCQIWLLHPWQVCCLASLFHWNWLLLGGSAHKLVMLAPDHFWVLSLTRHICCRHTYSLAGSKHHVMDCPILWKLSSLDTLLGTQLSNSTVLVTLDNPGWH